MVLLKRMAMVVMMSCLSETAIAQQTPPAAPSTHTEPWWNSKYGEADTIGALNNLSPKIVKDAARLIKTGKVYALGVPTGPDTPAYGNRKITIARTPGPGSDFTPNGTQRVTAFDEQVTTSMGIGTQIDGLAHLGVDHHYYNGIAGKDVAGSYILDLAEHSADRDARRAHRHDQALQEADAGSGRHVQQGRDRGRGEGAEGHDPEGRRGAVPHQLDREGGDRPGSLPLAGAGPRRGGRAVSRRNSASSPSDPTPSRSKRCRRRRARRSSFTRRCSPRTASTSSRASIRGRWRRTARANSCSCSARRASRARCRW